MHEFAVRDATETVSLGLMALESCQARTPKWRTLPLHIQRMSKCVFRQSMNVSLN